METVLVLSIALCAVSLALVSGAVVVEAVRRWKA